jgi:hypothetical protein
MDSLNSSNVDLQHELASKKKQIDKLNADLDKIVSEKSSDLNEARAKIQELTARIKDLLDEIEKLKEQNRELMANGGGAGGEGATNYKIVSGDSILVNTRPMKMSGGEAVPIPNSIAGGGRLQANGINIFPVQTDGKEKAGALSKFTSSLKVVFELSKDSLVGSGNKELFLVLSAPNGSVISGPADPKAPATAPASGAFQQADGVQKVYTVKLTPYYDKGNGSKVEYTWKQNTKFNPGEYKAEVFFNGNKIGEGKQNLKRGTKPFPF